MKFYKYQINRNGNLSCEILESTGESPKMYFAKDEFIYKNEIGKLSGDLYDTVILLERNPSLAASLLIKQKEKEIATNQKIIDNLKKIIK